MKKIAIFLALILVSVNAYAVDYIQPQSDITTRIGAPQESDWYTMVSDAETATTDAYDPFNAEGTKAIPMVGFTGVLVRAKFTAAMGTDPIVACFGKRGSDWGVLKDEDGAATSTLSDDATLENNTNDDTNYWTASSSKIDALGSDSVLCTVATAGVSASGTIAVEVTRY